MAKFWLEPVILQRSVRFSALEISRIERLVSDHQERLLESWNDYFFD